MENNAQQIAQTLDEGPIAWITNIGKGALEKAGEWAEKGAAGFDATVASVGNKLQGMKSAMLSPSATPPIAPQGNEIQAPELVRGQNVAGPSMQGHDKVQEACAGLQGCSMNEMHASNQQLGDMSPTAGIGQVQRQHQELMMS